MLMPSSGGMVLTGLATAVNRPKTSLVFATLALAAVALLLVATVPSQPERAELASETQWDRQLDAATERYLDGLAVSLDKKKSSRASSKRDREMRAPRDAEALDEDSRRRRSLHSGIIQAISEKPKASHKIEVDPHREVVGHKGATHVTFAEEVLNRETPKSMELAATRAHRSLTKKMKAHTLALAQQIIKAAQSKAVKSAAAPKSNRPGGAIGNQAGNYAAQYLKNEDPSSFKKPWVPPVSTALVARKLGLAIDRHERCRRVLGVKERELNTAEEKAKVAMREAREADAGVQHSVNMLKAAERLVEKARQFHENYVQEVTDSIDVRSQYTTEALQAHTLLEHMIRLKKRYDAAVQGLTTQQVKYNKLVAQIEGTEDKRIEARDRADDDLAQLALANPSSSTHGAATSQLSPDADPDAPDYMSLASTKTATKVRKTPARTHRAAHHAKPSVKKSSERSAVLGQVDVKQGARMKELKSRAQMLAVKAKKIFGSLPQLEHEKREALKAGKEDRDMLMEAQSDREMTEQRLKDGGSTKEVKAMLLHTIEKDSRQEASLQQQYLRDEAEVRRVRGQEAAGPEYEREAKIAKQQLAQAEKDAETARLRGAGLHLTAGFSLLAQIVAPLAKLSASQLKKDHAHNEMLAAASGRHLTKLESQARNIRSEMEIKRDIANQARKEYLKARNKWEHARHRVEPLEAALHDRSTGVQDTRAQAEAALQKAQQHLIATRRTSRMAAIAKRDADRRLRAARKLLYEKQEVVKNYVRCESGAWDDIQELTNNAKSYNIIGDGTSGVDYTTQDDLTGPVNPK